MPKSTATRVEGSGIKRTSPIEPKGLATIVSNAVIAAWAGHQPTPWAQRLSKSRARNALPRTWPAMSLLHAMISDSCRIGPFSIARQGGFHAV